MKSAKLAISHYTADREPFIDRRVDCGANQRPDAFARLHAQTYTFS